jgi:cyanophycin synthetase
MSSVWSPSRPQVQGFVRFAPNWRALSGMGFGPRMPTMLGVAQASLPDGIDFEPLHEALAHRIGETHAPGADGRTKAESLVAGAMFWAGALQRHAGIPVFGDAFVATLRRAGEVEAVRIAVPYHNSAATLTALRFVDAAINRFLGRGQAFDDGADVDAAWTALIATLKEYSPGGVNIFRMLATAHEVGIPTRFLAGATFSFGIGARSRWLQSSYTDRTPLIASQTAADKFATAQLLRAAGLPAPTHALVKTAEDALKATRQYGYPVVVKPADRQQGKGVAANLRSDADVVAAYEAARAFSTRILVEKHFDGTDHRMTVLNGRLIRAGARLPGGVTGDGIHSVAELVELRKREAAHAQRARERGRHLLDLDAEAIGLLAENGLSPNHIPKKDEHVRLRRRGNISAGAEPVRIALEKVHPDNRRLAEQAAAALRLDLAGIDIILPDIGRSWLETGALICEINGQPQIGRSAMPTVLLALMENHGRIPVVLVVGSGGGPDWTSLRREIPAPGAGLATPKGAWLDGEQIRHRPQSAFESSQTLIEDAGTTTLTIVMPPEEVLHFGLPIDRCDLLVLDSADRWTVQDPEALDDLLRLAVPHAKRVVSIGPAKSLSGFPDARAIAPAESDSLVELCAESLRSRIAADAAGT